MNKEDVLRWIIYIGAGLLLFTPLIVANGMYFPYITGKAFYFRAIVAVMFGAWSILMLYDKRVRIKASAVGWALMGLVVVAGVATIFGVNPDHSVWSNFERMMGWITLLHVGMLFITLAHTLKTEHWRNLFYVSLGVSALTALISFGEVGDVSRVDATLGNPIYLAVYAMFHAMLAGYFLIGRIKKRLRKSAGLLADWQLWIFTAVAAVNLLALWFTKTRGALLGLAAGLFVATLLVAVLAEKRSWQRRIAAGLAGVAVLLAGGLFAFQDSDFVQNQPVLERFANISLEEGTVGARLDIWELGLEGYAERPVLGWGPGNFNYVFNTYYNPELFDEETWFDRAHNVALEWLVAAGPLGALAYLSIFGAAIYLIWRDPEAEDAEGFSVVEKSLLTGLVIAYLVQNLSVFDHLVSYLVLTMFIGWLHARSSHEVGWLDFSISEEAKAWSGTGVAVLMVTLLALWNWPGFMQANTLIDALREKRQAPVQALETFQEAIDYKAMGTQEAREQLTQMARDTAMDQGASSTVAQDYLEVATEEIKAQISEEPGDLRHRVFYGQMLMGYEKYGAAAEQFGLASEMGNDRKQIILFQLAQAQEAAGNTEAALESYRKAYELDTSFDEPALRYAGAAIKAGEQVMADDVLEAHFGTTTVDHDILVNAYAEAENYAGAVPIFEKRLEENPDDPQSYISLAAVLERAGERTRSISVLEQAINKFPSIESQVSDVIRQIRAGNPVRP